MPGAIVFMRLPHSEEMVLWTSLVTFFRMPASSGRSRMSSSLTVKNLRCPDLVREIRNMPRLGVTGMTISTDGSMLLTSCTNFSFPSANSSIRLCLPSERASALARGQQLLHFGLDHLGRADLHRSHPLPADYPLLVNDVDVGDEPPAAVKLVGLLLGVDHVRIRDLERKFLEEVQDLLLGVAGRIHAQHLHVPALEGFVNLLQFSPLDQARLANVEEAEHHHLTFIRSEEHTSELQSPCNLVCRLLLEKKKKTILV